MNEIICGDALEKLKELPDENIDCCITSPPYFGLRDYQVDGQVGLEDTPQEYVSKLVNVFHEVKRILKKEGTLWLNLGDSYWGSHSMGTCSPEAMGIQKNLSEVYGSAKQRSWPKNIGLKPKDLVGIPWRVAFALQADGWYLRQDIIWAKPNPMPESITDRCTKSHEYVFLMTKSPKYYFDNDGIREKATSQGSIHVHHEGNKMSKVAEDIKMATKPQRTMVTGEFRNRRSVWTINTHPYSEAHFATFPEDLIVPMIKAGCPEGGVVLDPFMGAGTTAWVSKKLKRNWIGIELNPAYIAIANSRMAQGILI